MVYTQVLIVEGIILTRKQIEEFLELDEDSDIQDEFYDNLIDGFGRQKHLRGNAGLRLFTFPCCSDSKENVFILGYEVHSYWRSSIRCKKCEECSVCEKCIGETINGYYNVIAISNGPIQIPEEKICQKCSSDKVEDGRCRLCLCDQSVARRNFKTGYADEITKFASKVLKMENVSVNHYYMIDDCLSCT